MLESALQSRDRSRERISLKPEDIDDQQNRQQYNQNDETDHPSSRNHPERIRGFEKINSRTLAVKTGDTPVWIKRKSMLSYEQGKVNIKRPSIFETGFFRSFRQRFLRNSVQLSKATGHGQLYLADEGKKILLFPMKEGQSLSVKSSDVLAFEDSIRWQIRMMKHLAGAVRSGLFHVEFSGYGAVAMTCPGEAIVLPVSEGNPVFTNPASTVAWTGKVKSSLHIDASAKTFFGRGSGNTVQFKFEGSGFVIIKPF